MSASGSAGLQSYQGAEIVALELGQPFNAFPLFQGILVPNALVRYRDLSPTAKFLWARLARFAGKNRRV